ncbi:dTMP kinase [Alicyclobacillus tolerans]|nr:dTMP kinase [Alicyclobacillus tolerans]MCF8566278.1 dTMP kinase [Alicyclobacillus tolerans]
MRGMGLFITFEGLDGAGKSTQIERLHRRLTGNGKQVVLTREPGGTPVGDRLRDILLDPDQTNLSMETEVLLYAASRAQLLHEVIRPALKQNKTVLCDRYVDASLAYQGAGLGIGVDRVGSINAFATQQLKPDLTFLFDLPVQLSQTRVAYSRGRVQPDRIERRDAEYFNRVRDEFLEIARRDPARVVVLNASRPVEDLEKEIWDVVQKHLEHIEGSIETH